MKLEKWDQSGTWISTILQRFARKKCFSNFLGLFQTHKKIKDISGKWLQLIIVLLNGSEKFFQAKDFQESIKLQIVKTLKNSISLKVFFSGQKTANETFQGFPELHFECKFQIYALKKYLVTKQCQILRVKKWDQSGTFVLQFYKFSPEKCF